MEKLRQGVMSLREKAARNVAEKKPGLSNLLTRALAGEPNLRSARAEHRIESFVHAENIKFDQLTNQDIEAMKNWIAIYQDTDDAWLDEVTCWIVAEWEKEKGHGKNEGLYIKYRDRWDLVQNFI